MNNKFIYVFSPDDRDLLLSNGCCLLKADETQNLYIFKYNNEAIFSKHDIAFVMSDVLTF